MLSKERCNELYVKHAPNAFRRARHVLGDAADADDVVQDVFLALFERYEQFRGDSSLSTYIYSAVTHACLNRLRSRRQRDMFSRTQLTAAAPHDSGRGPESAAAARSLLSRLPSPLAEVAVYYYLDELSQREIASILKCSHVHVAELIARVSRSVSRQELKTCQR